MATSAISAHSRSVLLSAILKTIENRLIPITRDSLAEGGAPFGAAILMQSNLEPVTVSINAWRESPLLHGETNCIREFFQNPPEARPDTESCIFFATHEPCSLCLSGIAWTGFPLVFFLYTYEDTRDLLGIAGDIEILQEIFRVRAPGDTDETLAARPLYNKQNKFFSVKSIADLVEEIDDIEEKERIKKEIQKVREVYDEFSRDWSSMQAERPTSN
jgi:tRNA(Arg) A34 adenosine deaminase TadA